MCVLREYSSRVLIQIVVTVYKLFCILLILFQKENYKKKGHSIIPKINQLNFKYRQPGPVFSSAYD